MSHETGSGSTLEQTVTGTLQSKGFVLVSFKDWSAHPEKYADELLLTNVPFETIYRHKGRTEFLLKSKKFTLEARIECKWQQSAGSVDEKLPYLYLNAIEAMPEKDIVIVIDGAGWKPGSIEWLRTAVAESKYQNDAMKEKRISVFDLKEFLTWANTTLR